jgi:hypothetical protein
VNAVRLCEAPQVPSAISSFRQKIAGNPVRQPATDRIGSPDRMKTKRRESILWIVAGGFLLLIFCVWLTEWLRVPHRFFGEASDFNWGRPLFRTALVGTIWLIVHLATRRLLKRLHHLEEYLLICAWCRKIGYENKWITLEDYSDVALTMKTTHGMCPTCRDVVVAEVQRPIARKA